MKIFILLLAISFPSITYAQSEREGCSFLNYAACSTCENLSKEIRKINLKENSLDEGSYVHGILKNPLFAAYYLNCKNVGEKLLQQGADPSIGGTWGSMAITVSNKWPHNNSNINFEWMELLIRYKIKIDKKTYLDEKTAAELIYSKENKVDYLDIWNKILESQKIKSSF